jgi:hypothetical protein
VSRTGFREARPGALIQPLLPIASRARTLTGVLLKDVHANTSFLRYFNKLKPRPGEPFLNKLLRLKICITSACMTTASTGLRPGNRPRGHYLSDNRLSCSYYTLQRVFFRVEFTINWIERTARSSDEYPVTKLYFLLI